MAAVAKKRIFCYFLLFGPVFSQYENGLKIYISSIFRRMPMSQNFDQVPVIKNANNLNLSLSYSVM